jgi:cyclomaltodextrin glucanotransferase
MSASDDWQGTFIDNHDQMRSLVRLKILGVPDWERPRLLDLATVLLMTVRGIPIIYYGDEQYLAHYQAGYTTTSSEVNSSNDDPFNRPGMRSWDEATPSFKIIKALAEQRWNNPAVWRGSFEVLFASEDILVFERKYQNHSLLVAVNRGEATNVAIPYIDQEKRQYKNVLSGTSETNNASRFVTQNGDLVLGLAKFGALALAR